MKDMSFEYPFSTEAEQTLLGSLIANPDHIGRVGKSNLFYDEVHKELFEAIKKRDRQGLSINAAALEQFAEGHEGLKELGGSKYLARLISIARPARDIPHYTDILSDLKSKRDIVDAAEQSKIEIAQGQDPADIIAGRLEAAIINVGSSSKHAPVSMLKATTQAVQQVLDAHSGENKAYVNSGIKGLDHFISGFHPGELILLGGRPSMGKTALALNIALNVARQGHGVVICSFEMNPDALALRAISEATNKYGDPINYTSMRAGQVKDLEAFKNAAKEVSELPITFLSRHYSDIGALFAGAKQSRRILGEDKMKLLIVDYVQLMRSNTANRYELITEISTALKNLAGQLNVPILALSQLSRQVESREDKRPMLADLRESGQLEQDADAVLFCYRDEYYLQRQEPELGKNPEKREAWENAMRATKGRLEIIVAKQRQGAVGTVKLRCNLALNKIWED